MRAPLTDLDVVTIIARRLERLRFMSARLTEFAKSDRAVPTAVCSPLLDKLQTELSQERTTRIQPA